MEGFLLYQFRGLIFGGAHFRNFTVYLINTNMRTKSIQKQVKSFDVDKVGGKKTLASKSCFV